MSRIVQCFSVFFHRSTYVRLCTYVHSRFWGVLLPCPLPMSRFVQSFSIRKFSGCTTYNVHSRCWGVLLPCPLPMSRFVQSFSGRCDSWYTAYNIRICPVHSTCNLHAQYNHVRTASADCHAAAAYTVSTTPCHSRGNPPMCCPLPRGFVLDMMFRCLSFVISHCFIGLLLCFGRFSVLLLMLYLFCCCIACCSLACAVLFDA